MDEHARRDNAHSINSRVLWSATRESTNYGAVLPRFSFRHRRRFCSSFPSVRRRQANAFIVPDMHWTLPPTNTAETWVL